MSLIRDKYGNWVENDAAYANAVRNGTYTDPNPNDKSFARDRAAVQNSITEVPAGTYSNQADFSKSTNDIMLQMERQKALNQGYVERGQWTQAEADRKNALIDQYTSNLNNKYTIANNIRANGGSTDPSNIAEIQASGGTVAPVYGSGYGQQGYNNYANGGYYGGSILDEIDSAKNSRIASRKSALQDVYNKAQSNLASEKSAIAPQYQQLKNNESSTAQLRAKRIGEYMAAKGYSEGYAGQDEVARNVALKTNLGNINTQEQNAYNDIARRGTAAQSEYDTGLLQAQNDADTWASEQKLAELGTLRDYARQDAATNAEQQRYNDQFAYQQSQDALNRQDSINASLGYVNPYANVVVPDSIKQQLAKYSNNYAAYANTLSDSDPMKKWAIVLGVQKMFNDPALLAKYGEQFKTSAQKQQDLENQLTQQQLEAKATEAKSAAAQQAFENALAAWKAAGTASQAISSILGVPVGARTADYNISSIQTAISQQNANTSSRNASTTADRFAYEKEQDKSKASTSAYNNYLQQGYSMKNTGTSYQGTFSPRYTDDQIKTWVLGLPIDNETAARLLSDLGV